MVIISNKHGIYELPQKLANDLRKLGNIEKISKLSSLVIEQNFTLVLSLPPKMKILLILAKKTLEK